MQPGQLEALLKGWADRTPGATVLMLTGEAAEKPAHIISSGLTVEWRDDIKCADDLPMPASARYVVVSGILAGLDGRAAIQLLCRLRDSQCEQIVLMEPGNCLTARELLSVGFYRCDEDETGGRSFRYDRDQFFEPRQWNSPEKWAHPENFRKYRW